MIDLIHPNKSALLEKWAEKLHPHQAISQWTTLNELCWLAEAASRVMVVGEVGSYKGKSAKAMSMACNGTIYCVDRFQDNTQPDFERNLQQELEDGKVALTPLESKEAADALDKADIKFDFFFVDGSHAKLDVLRDIAIWIPMMKEGSIMAFHDCYPGERENGVSQALESAFPDYHLVIDSIAAIRLP